MNRWCNKVAVVTGASSGIGAAITLALAQNGVKVAGFSRRAEKVKELAETLNSCSGEIHPICCDVTKEDDIERAFNWVDNNLGPVSILINNAGFSKMSPLTEGPIDVWRATIDTNLMAACICTKLAIQSMKKSEIEGHVINVNSLAGHKVYHFEKHRSLYAASKFGLRAMTETLRLELVAQNSKIRVSSISPGRVWTEMADKSKYPVDTPGLEPIDIANTVMHIIAAPQHVQICEVIIKPVGEDH